MATRKQLMTTVIIGLATALAAILGWHERERLAEWLELAAKQLRGTLPGEVEPQVMPAEPAPPA